MGQKRVHRHIPTLRYGFLLLCLLAAATALIGQTNPYSIPTGSVPTALAINPATNKIYVVNTQGIHSLWSMEETWPLRGPV